MPAMPKEAFSEVGEVGDKEEGFFIDSACEREAARRRRKEAGRGREAE